MTIYPTFSRHQGLSTCFCLDFTEDQDKSLNIDGDTAIVRLSASKEWCPEFSGDPEIHERFRYTARPHIRMYKTGTGTVWSRRSALEEMGEEQYRADPGASRQQEFLRPGSH